MAILTEEKVYEVINIIKKAGYTQGDMQKILRRKKLIDFESISGLRGIYKDRFHTGLVQGLIDYFKKVDCSISDKLKKYL